MKRIIPLTPRRWLALEIFRRMKHERVEEIYERFGIGLDADHR